MGALKDVGFLADNGKLSDAQTLEIIDDICNIIRTAPAVDIAGVNFPLTIPAVPSAADPFAANDGVDRHREKFAQWHTINLDIFLAGVANMFDGVPTSGVAAKVIPIIDPTQPIIDILNALKDLFPDLFNFDIIEFLTSIIAALFLKIPIFLAKIAALAVDIIEGALDKIEEAIGIFIDFIKENIVEKLDKAQQEINEIKEKIDRLIEESIEFKNKIIDKIKQFALKILSFLSIPTFSLTLPSFDFSLAFPNFNLPSLPIFYIGFPPGIAYFFIEFIKRLIQGIISLLANITDLIAAFLQGIVAVIKYLVQAIFNIVISILRSLIPDLSKAVTFAATIVTFVKKITQMAIVSIIGWLVGPGIIINVVAREVGLVS